MLNSRRVIAFAAFGLSLTALAGCSTTSTLNTDEVQTAISSGLTEQIGGTYTVSCPSTIEVKVGATFTCDVTDAATGQTAQVTGTQDDDQGHFTWKVTSAGSASPAASPAAS